MNSEQPKVLINSFEQCGTDYKLANKIVIKMKTLHVLSKRKNLLKRQMPQCVGDNSLAESKQFL